jgi:drug/metabolite transporter (DMT)-like permease
VPRDARTWGLLAQTGGVAFALNYGLIFWGEQRITSGLAAVLQAMIPAFGLIFAHYHLPAERITWRKIIGVGVGIVGVGLIFYDQMQLESVAALHGCAALIGSSICVAYANVLVKARLQHLEPPVLAAGQMLCGFIPLLIIGTLWEGNPLALQWTPQAWFALLYLALIGSAVAFLLYYWLVQRVAVTKTMLIALVTPVLALLIGKLTLDERVTWRIAVGSVAIVAGISLIIVQRKQQPN